MRLLKFDSSRWLSYVGLVVASHATHAGSFAITPATVGSSRISVAISAHYVSSEYGLRREI